MTLAGRLVLFDLDGTLVDAAAQRLGGRHEAAVSPGG